MIMREFVRESNAIEGIHRDPLPEEVEITEHFLRLGKITVLDLERLVGVYAPGHQLRDKPGRNVRVGDYIAPPGGPALLSQLSVLLRFVSSRSISAYEAHVEYELIHPFTDGNGRSGRALWLWLMYGDAPLGFLHTFYYQTLAAASSPKPQGGADG